RRLGFKRRIRPAFARGSSSHWAAVTSGEDSDCRHRFLGGFGRVQGPMGPNRPQIGKEMLVRFARRLSSRILRGGGWRSPATTVALATTVLIATLLAMPAAEAASTGQMVGAGYDGYAQLCNAPTTGGSTAIGTVSPLDASVTVTAMAAGAVHSLALTSAGTIYACGRNNFGQLGNGTTRHSPPRVAVTLPGSATAAAVAANEFHSLALTSTGAVYAWGHNAFGQLGNGTTTDSSTPVAVAVPGTVTKIAAGWAFDLALPSTGAVYAWGFNGDGELGTTSADSCGTGPYPCNKTP